MQLLKRQEARARFRWIFLALVEAGNSRPSKNAIPQTTHGESNHQSTLFATAKHRFCATHSC